MLDLDVLEPLLKLVLHEDKNVHRNACMALGSMALHRKCYFNDKEVYETDVYVNFDLKRYNCTSLDIIYLADVRRSLRKREETIPSMVALLSPEGQSL